MIFAWLLSAPLAMIFSRYMKKTWLAKQVFGKDIWFVVSFNCSFVYFITNCASLFLFTRYSDACTTDDVNMDIDFIGIYYHIYWCRWLGSDF